MKEYPYFPVVPLDYAENLRWRLRVREKAEHDKALQQQLIQMCREDFLFFLAAFCWLYEPRPRKGPNGLPLPTIIPFLPWIHQIPAIKLIDEALGFEDIVAEKSRGEGASWIACMIVLWLWLFHSTQAIGLVSRNELAVDNPDDPDSLMWKLDWELTKLPPWMAGELGVDYTRNVSKHVLRNVRNGSTITGYACTGDVATGGRKSVMVIDELSKFPRGPDQEALDSTGPVTDCRFIISTPKGAEGAYHALVHSDAQMVRITLDWKDNPSRNRGLFRIGKAKTADEGYRGSKVILVDEDRYGGVDLAWLKDFYERDLKRLGDRGYAVSDEHKQWSPWYVKQCLRPGATPQSVAQEYDRDYGGSVSRFFNGPLIDRLIVENAVNPVYIGDLHFDGTRLNESMFIENQSGNLKIWCPLVHGKFTPRNTDYIVSADVALGQGGVKSSNSTIVVVDRNTGKKVAEFASPITPPEQLANYAIALCMFFGGKSRQAYLIWESNGCGAMFKNRVLETSFRNFYYRTTQDEVTRKRTKKAGWTTQKNSKRELLGQYAYSLAEGFYVNTSRLALAECKDYVLMANGSIEHLSAATCEDPSGAKENHGDRVIADAMANWVLYETREGKRESPEPLEAREERIPPTSILAMRNEILAKEAKQKGTGYW